MIITRNVTSFTSCPFRASRCCRVRATVAQNWRSLGLEIQVTGAHNRTPENAERREKLKKKESEHTYTWHLKMIQFWRRGASSSKNTKSRTGMDFRDEDTERMAREDIETRWTISVLFWDHRVESQSSFTTGLLFLTILNLVNNRLLNVYK